MISNWINRGSFIVLLRFFYVIFDLIYPKIPSPYSQVSTLIRNLQSCFQTTYANSLM